MNDHRFATASLMLRGLGVLGVVGGVVLLWTLAQPVDPEALPGRARTAVGLGFLFLTIAAVAAVLVHMAAIQRGDGGGWSQLDALVARVSLVFLFLGLAGLLVGGLRYLRVGFSLLLQAWNELRIRRMNERLARVESDGDMIFTFFGALRTVWQIFRTLAFDMVLRLVTLIYLFVLWLGYQIGNWLILPVIPLLAVLLVQRSRGSAMSLIGLVVFHAGLAVTLFLSGDDLWYTEVVPRFLFEVTYNGALVIYRFLLFAVIMAAALSRVTLLWVVIGGAAYGALLYLMRASSPCVQMLASDSCASLPTEFWVHAVFGILLFGCIQALAMVIARREAHNR